jgi:hypothetical protein
MKISRTVSFGMGAVMALVIGSGTAYAATGGKFILGKSNTAGKTTKLTNPNGSALALYSKSGTPSLKVNRTTKVPNLNSDRLDGLDQSSFARAAGQTNSVSGVGELLDLTLPADGTPDIIAAFATCPAGTRLTGGGGDDFTSDGVMWTTSPASRTTWVVSTTSATLTAENAENLIAYAQCYNPRGAVPGGELRTSSPTRPSAETMAAVKAKLAKKVN